jgi:hypothetical protein
MDKGILPGMVGECKVLGSVCHVNILLASILTVLMCVGSPSPKPWWFVLGASHVRWSATTSMTISGTDMSSVSSVLLSFLLVLPLGSSVSFWGC